MAFHSRRTGVSFFKIISLQEQGYSLPDWLVDTTSGATGALTDSSELEDGAKPADFAALWAKSKISEAYAKEFDETLAKLKADPAPLKALPTSGPGQLKALWTLLSYRTSHLTSTPGG